MLTTVAEIKSNEPRFTGSGRLLYEQVQTYFDLEALFLPEEPDAAMLARSPALRAAVDAYVLPVNPRLRYLSHAVWSRES